MKLFVRQEEKKERLITEEPETETRFHKEFRQTHVWEGVPGRPKAPNDNYVFRGDRRKGGGARKKGFLPGEASSLPFEGILRFEKASGERGGKKTLREGTSAGG